MSKVVGISINEDEADVIRIRTRRPSFGLFSKAFMKSHSKHLVGTRSSRFFLDLAYYGSNLYQKNLYSLAGVRKSGGSLAIVFLIDRFVRFKVQLFGFLLMSLLLIATAVPIETSWRRPSNKSAFLAIYSLGCFFSTFGPTSATFIVPVELFPACLRSTCHWPSCCIWKSRRPDWNVWVRVCRQ
ncbi:low affinity inorganic phosphate transporter 3-like [Cryptomeria japonica]|uniref:low affinity inorganic phosphate transporter 3-like n=1 Tax=Cryptomeria japonica TaxID=3369 RepID=UPI0027DA9706|nr:low affinity inorganic phosphate transporter 3-like [Cryptomeria japonica]